MPGRRGRLTIALPAQVERDAFGPPPAAVTVRLIDAGGAGEVEDVELAILPSTVADVPGLLARMPQLRTIQALSAGVDWLLPHVPERVAVCNARGVFDAPVAEWVVGAILAMHRQFPRLVQAQGTGTWAPLPAEALFGNRVLIAGYGSIGRALEARLAPFEVRVERVARRPREGVHGPDQLERLAASCDVVIDLLPLTARTRRIFDGALLEALPSGALFVNAGRGETVDTDALLALLGARRLRAALDVVDPEPLPATHPLWSAPGALITPHVAGIAGDGVRRAFAFARAQVDRLLAGKPLLNVVDADPKSG